MVGIMLFLMWLGLAIMTISFGKDIFSPSKFYILNLGVYFASIFYKEYSDSTHYVYLFYLILGIGIILYELKFSVITEKKMKMDSKHTNINEMKINKVIKGIWIISLIPLLAQIYLIYSLGGIQSYINNLGFRVVTWRGMGIVLELIKLFNLLNVIYFAILLNLKKKSFSKWCFFAVHLIIFIIIALLSGSRGGLLTNFVQMLLCYHYIKRRVNVRNALTMGIVLMLAASALGVARNGYKLTDEGFSSGLSSTENTLDFSQFEYGLNPLELVYSSNNTDFEYGLTYLSMITNVIPRRIWPGKPDTGGVVLTKKYTGNAWGGYSNLSTGFMAEGVINFGKFWGSIIGVIPFLITILMLFSLYKKMLNQTSKSEISYKNIFTVVLYTFVVTSIPNLLFAEWTKITVTLILKYVKLMMVYYFIFREKDGNIKNIKNKHFITT